MTDSLYKASPLRPLGLLGSARIQIDVISALILRDLRTRFGNVAAFVIAILWPLAHIAILVAIYTVLGVRDWLGSDPVVFLSIGVVQFILFFYLLRWISVAIVEGRSLVVLPRVKLIDLILARVVVEVVVGFGIVLSTIATIVLWGSTFAPFDPLQFIGACGASILLGVGIGIMGSVLVGIRPRLVIIILLICVGAYAASGVVFLPATVPEPFRSMLAWSPLMHSVEWAREAYYPDYHSLVLNKSYVIAWGIGGMLIGLVMERLFRVRILQT